MQQLCLLMATLSANETQHLPERSVTNCAPMQLGIQRILSLKHGTPELQKQGRHCGEVLGIVRGLLHSMRVHSSVVDFAEAIRN
jgi:hypothetical protein